MRSGLPQVDATRLDGHAAAGRESAREVGSARPVDPPGVEPRPVQDVIAGRRSAARPLARRHKRRGRVEVVEGRPGVALSPLRRLAGCGLGHAGLVGWLRQLCFSSERDQLAFRGRALRRLRLSPPTPSRSSNDARIASGSGRRLFLGSGAVVLHVPLVIGPGAHTECRHPTPQYLSGRGDENAAVSFCSTS